MPAPTQDQKDRRKGIQALLDWLGDGGQPVSSEEAARRAAICGTCPRNKLFSWKDLAKRGVASLIAMQLQHRHKMKLETPHDRHIGMCDACGCVLRLKTWVPIDYALDNLTPEVEAKLDSRCWILAAKKGLQ